jgi:hypothetical protein
MADKLTKYKSATTIFTADAANAIYGGLFGSSEGDRFDADDPRLIGHAHDGQHIDGHAQKIHLEDHVTGQLMHVNLGDEAVTKRNIAAFIDPSLAIPVSEIRGSDTYYYIDVTTLPEQGAFKTDPPVTSTEGSPPEVTSNSPGDLTSDDFVFGSDSVDHDSNSDHYNRIIYDKSKGALRAGITTDVFWDEFARGVASVAFGEDNAAAFDYSAVLSGTGSSAASELSVIAGGELNFTFDIGAGGSHHFIGGGYINVIVSDGDENAIVGGNGGQISGTSARSMIGSGVDNTIDDSDYGFIGTGNDNEIDEGDYNFIGSGKENRIKDGSFLTGPSYSFIGTGEGNEILDESDYSAIVSGFENLIDNSAKGNFIGAGGYFGGVPGNGNKIENTNDNVAGESNGIVSGYGNLINGTGGGYNLIGAGAGNLIGSGQLGSWRSGIISGSGNAIVAETTDSFIGSGIQNSIIGNSCAIVAGGVDGLGNSIATYGGIGNFIGAGQDNTITGSSIDHSVITGGSGSSISTEYAGITSGRDLVIEEEADYGFSSGYKAASRALGEMSNASHALLDTVPGSSQQTTVVFSREIEVPLAIDYMYLDGVSQQSYIRSNSLIYVTLELVVTNKNGSKRFGARRRAMIHCDGGGISTAFQSTVTDVINPDASAWSFSVNTPLANHWRIVLTPPGGDPVAENFLAVCVVTGAQVIYAV